MRIGIAPSLTKGLISVVLIYSIIGLLIYGCTTIINAQTEPTPTEDTGIGRATPTQPVTPTAEPSPSAAPTELPTATAVAPEDRYEPDSFTMPPAYAGPAERSFNPVGDNDYFLFRLTANMPTYFETFSLQGGADTEIILYDAETGGALGQDNNGGGGLASRVVLQLPTSKLIKVEIRNYALAFGPSVRYQFRIITEAELPPTSTPTPSRTPTITPSPTATMTPSATPTMTPTPRPLVTATATPTALPTGSWFTRTPIPVLPTPIVTIVVTPPIPTVVLPTIWPTHAPTATPTTAPTPLPTGPWFTRPPPPSSPTPWLCASSPSWIAMGTGLWWTARA